MATIKIVAAVLDTQQLTLYKENGETVIIPQGDARIRPIIDIATAPLSRGEVVEINMDQPNHYEEFEKQSSGLVKFFRVMKKTVKHIFGADEEETPLEPQKLGVVPVPVPTGSTAAAVRDATTNVKPDPKAAIDQIMAAAVPVSAPEFSEKPTGEDHTIIAVVDNKIIPGMEKLENQFAHANKLGSPTGVQNFLKRLTAVIDKRGHSVDDLLKFMERGDLPIADDGCIIAYKRLFTQGNHADVFVDPHTRNVTQKVGSYVFMNEKLVDPNRRNECSNGLHIGRRQYMGSFSGDVIVMCKIKPEDVIAVPAYDSNKMRVCGYHILFKCPSSAFSAICSNRPLSEDSEAGKLLGQALRGEHVKVLQTVEITASRGGGLKIKNLVGEAQANQAVKRAIEDAKTGEAASAFDDPKSGVSAVDPNAVDKQVTATKAAKTTEKPKVTAPKVETRAERITRLSEVIRTGTNAEKTLAANELVQIQKSAKKSFEKLGISKATIVSINNLVAPVAAPTPPKPAAKAPEKPKIEPKKAASKIVKNKDGLPILKSNKSALPTHFGDGEPTLTKATEKKVAKTVPTKAKPTKKPEAKKVTPKKTDKTPLVPDKPVSDMGRNEKAKWYLKVINEGTDDEQRQAYKDLIDLKKKAKVSWSQLNVVNFDAIQAKFEK